MDYDILPKNEPRNEDLDWEYWAANNIYLASAVARIRNGECTEQVLKSTCVAMAKRLTELMVACRSEGVRDE